MLTTSNYSSSSASVTASFIASAATFTEWEVEFANGLALAICIVDFLRGKKVSGRLTPAHHFTITATYLTTKLWQEYASNSSESDTKFVEIYLKSCGNKVQIRTLIVKKQQLHLKSFGMKDSQKIKPKQ